MPPSSQYRGPSARQVMVEVAQTYRQEIFGADNKMEWSKFIDRGKALSFDTNRDVRRRMSEWLGALCLSAPRPRLEGDEGFLTALFEMCDDDTDEVTHRTPTLGPTRTPLLRSRRQPSRSWRRWS